MRRFTTDANGQQWVDHGMGWVPVAKAAQPSSDVNLPQNPCPPPGYPNHTIRNGNYCCQPSGCVPRPSTPARPSITIAVTQSNASRIAGACASAGGTWVGGCVHGECTGSCTARSGVTGSSITWTGSPV